MVSLNSSIKTPFYAANQTIIKNSQIPFKGNSQESETEGKKPPVLLISLAAAAAILAAGAGHKTYSVKNALKEANLKENNISLTGIFRRNLNPVNWFKKEDAIKSLTDIECTKIGDSNILFKTKDGDVVLLDRSKVFDVKKGDGENVEEFVEKMKKSSTKTDDISTKTDSVPTKLPEGINPETIKAIKALPQEATEENVQKTTNLILKDMGFDPEKTGLKIEYINVGMEGNFGAFKSKEGKLLLSKDFLDKDCPETVSSLAPLIRHELDHFEKFGKIYKKIGANEFSKFINDVFPETKGIELNKDFWNNATKNLNIESFDHIPFTEGLKKQQEMVANIVDSYSNETAKLNYVSNPLEKSAYKIQNDFETALNVNVTPFEEGVNDFIKINKALDKYIEKNAKITKKYPELKNKLYNYFAFNAKTVEEAIQNIEKTPLTDKIIKEGFKLNISEKITTIHAQPILKNKIIQSLDKDIDMALKLPNLDSKNEMDLLLTKIHTLNGGNIKFEDCAVQKDSTFANIKVPKEIRERLIKNDAFKKYYSGLWENFFTDINSESFRQNSALSELITQNPLYS